MPGIGANNEKMQVILHKDFHKFVKALADASDLSVSHYIRRLLEEAVEQHVVYPKRSGRTFSSAKSTTPIDPQVADILEKIRAHANNEKPTRAAHK